MCLMLVVNLKDSAMEGVRQWQHVRLTTKPLA